jgi:hypothetical protein
MSLLDRAAAISKTGFVGAAPRFATGFHASAVDLGKLQTALAQGLSRFDMAQVRDRWDEIHEWMHQALRAWVQRSQFVKLEVRRAGIHVSIQTQDDHGTYTYGLDVSPGKEER